MTATLTGRLIAPDIGKPVAGTITLTPPTAITYGGAIVTRAPVRITVTDGTVNHTGIVPGRYTLAVHPAIGARWSFPVDLTAGTNEIEALLPATNTPEPILRGPTGRGIVSITDDDGDGTATVTYTDGDTEPLPLPPGPPQIRLDTDGTPYLTGV